MSALEFLPGNPGSGKGVHPLRPGSPPVEHPPGAIGGERATVPPHRIDFPADRRITRVEDRGRALVLQDEGESLFEGENPLGTLVGLIEDGAAFRRGASRGLHVEAGVPCDTSSGRTSGRGTRLTTRSRSAGRPDDRRSMTSASVRPRYPICWIGAKPRRPGLPSA